MKLIHIVKMKAPYKSPWTRAYLTVVTMSALGIGVSDYTRMITETSDIFLAVFHTIFVLSLVSGTGYLIYLISAYYIVPKLCGSCNSNDSDEQESRRLQTAILTATDSNKKSCIMDDILSYSSLTFERHLSENQIQVLCNNIQQLAKGKDVSDDITVKLDGVTSNDLYHFGWNIGKRLKRSNIQIAWFLKDTFKIMFSDVAVDTIQTKLAIKEGTFTLKLIPLDQPLIPHVFPATGF